MNRALLITLAIALSSCQHFSGFQRAMEKQSKEEKGLLRRYVDGMQGLLEKKNQLTEILFQPDMLYDYITGGKWTKAQGRVHGQGHEGVPTSEERQNRGFPGRDHMREKWIWDDLPAQPNATAVVGLESDNRDGFVENEQNASENAFSEEIRALQSTKENTAT